jgi:UDP-N-acetyl-D-glucosamine dehydrogenase
MNRSPRTRARNGTLNGLLRRIAHTEAVVGVIGLGYVGLPLALLVCRKGFDTIGFDIDDDKIIALTSGRSYIAHIPAPTIRAAERFKPTSDFSLLRTCDVIIICVPTPTTSANQPDLRPVKSTARVIARYLRRGHLVVLESTTYPTTTRDVVRPILERSGLKTGEEYFLAFSPEREDPGRTDHTTETIPKVVGGVDERSARAACAFYAAVVHTVVPVASAEIAESTKMLENTFRAVNIALVNELKMIFDRLGINIWDVIAASATKPFGFMPFYPGPGWGGHCIPVDPFYLAYLARKHRCRAGFIELAGRINTAMPEYVVAKTAQALRSHGKALRGARILLLGLSYKKDVGDPRESPTFPVMELLEGAGAQVSYSDPFIPQMPRMRRFRTDGRTSVPVTPRTLAAYDAVIIVTNHTSFDYDMILRHARLIVDTRNVYPGAGIHG